MLRNKKENKYSQKGFTLIELLVVIAIISLLSSIALIAFQSARAKSRNVKRIGDMTQMNTGLELYFASNKGYPSSVSGLPSGLAPQYASVIPASPAPSDGVCDGLSHGAACVSADPSCTGIPANSYYYVALGAGYTGSSGIVYPSYTYYFCLGDLTGNFAAGERLLTPSGVK